jgi:hypothetical protein
MNWVLIVFMFSPGGDYINRTVTEFESKKQCEVALKRAVEKHPLGVKQNGICVTKDHWTGKKYMDNVALD